ncbi:MAG: hypothetical protein ACTHU0_00180 [Kofleriaceae bacterium]
MTRRGWIGVDLDRTLAYHEPGQGVDDVGFPIPKMLERVKRWLAEGQEVRIVTARVAPEWNDVSAQRALIQAWCVEHLGEALPVQCHKDGAMLQLWDDRAVAVVPNDGTEVLTMLIKRFAETPKDIAEIRDYDVKHAADVDPVARFEVVMSDPVITVDLAGDSDPTEREWLTPREALVLVARILRAVGEAERHFGKAAADL